MHSSSLSDSSLNSESPEPLNLGQARNKLYSPIKLNNEPNSSRDINSSDPYHLKNQKELENKSEQSALELNPKQIIAQGEAITVHCQNNRPSSLEKLTEVQTGQKVSESRKGRNMTNFNRRGDIASAVNLSRISKDSKG